MLRRRYRVHFHVRFEHEVEAMNIEEARYIASDMADNAWPPLINGMLTGELNSTCAWSIIEPLGTPSERDLKTG